MVPDGSEALMVERGRGLRAFSLLEMMVVVAILGVIAAIAVPNLLPAVRLEALNAGGHATAAFATQARLAAMAERRCVRLRVEQATAPAILVAERLNTFDCETPTTSPLIDSALPLWVEFSRQRQEIGALSLAFSPGSAETASELRFRPSGRTFSADADLDDDDAVLVLTHPDLDSPNSVRVLIDAAGPICALARGQLPLGTGNTLACP
jgi:prepilin-type N-terminal cleavage/methylation domain-containing protein